MFVLALCIAAFYSIYIKQKYFVLYWISNSNRMTVAAISPLSNRPVISSDICEKTQLRSITQTQKSFEPLLRFTSVDWSKSDFTDSLASHLVFEIWFLTSQITPWSLLNGRKICSTSKVLSENCSISLWVPVSFYISHDNVWYMRSTNHHQSEFYSFTLTHAQSTDNCRSRVIEPKEKSKAFYFNRLIFKYCENSGPQPFFLAAVSFYCRPLIPRHL